MEERMEVYKRLFKDFNLLYSQGGGLVGISSNYIHVKPNEFTLLSKEQVVNTEWNANFLEMSSIIEDIKFITLITPNMKIEQS